MISNWNTKLAILFCVGIIVVGPGLFIIANTTNALGLMLQNFVQMSLYTDPIGQTGFPQSWTIFLLAILDHLCTIYWNLHCKSF